MSNITKRPIGQMSFNYQKNTVNKAINPKQIPSFCSRKNISTPENSLKPQTLLTFKPESNSHVKRFSMNTTGLNIGQKGPNSSFSIQFKYPKDNRQKQRQERSRSVPKRNNANNIQNSMFNKTQSPKYFSHTQQQQNPITFRNTCTEPFHKSDPTSITQQSNQKTLTKETQTPNSPNKSGRILFEQQTNIPTKYSSNPQSDSKSSKQDQKQSSTPTISVQFINRTNVVNKLAFDLNQKQHKICQLQNKLLSNKNQLSQTLAENTRRLNIQKRQKFQLLKQKQELERQLNSIKKINSQLVLTHQKQKQQLQNLKENQSVMNQKLQELSKNNQILKSNLQRKNQNQSLQISQEIITVVKKQLEEKGNRIIQLQNYNQSILIELQRVKIDICSQYSPIPTYSLPQQGNFNIFQQAFKTYITQTQKYKEIIKEKERDHEEMRQKYNNIRIQNQRLKNQLKIQEIRRATDLRNKDKISSINKQSIMNELKDAKRELSLSKQKTQRLSNEIKVKDEFIMKNIKTVK